MHRCGIIHDEICNGLSRNAGGWNSWPCFDHPSSSAGHAERVSLGTSRNALSPRLDYVYERIANAVIITFTTRVRSREPSRDLPRCWPIYIADEGVTSWSARDSLPFVAMVNSTQISLKTFKSETLVLQNCSEINKYLFFILSLFLCILDDKHLG